MYDKRAHQQYKSVQISTVDRGRLLLMMYDGGVKFLKQAKTGLETKDSIKFARFLSKGQAIIAELQNTLDFEAGGAIAKDLDRLYDFMLFYLTEANIQKNPAKIQKVIDLLDTISSAYRQIIEGDSVATQRAVEQAEEQMKGAREAKMDEVKAPTQKVANDSGSVPSVGGLRISL